MASPIRDDLPEGGVEFIDEDDGSIPQETSRLVSPRSVTRNQGHFGCSRWPWNFTPAVVNPSRIPTSFSVMNWVSPLPNRRHLTLTSFSNCRRSCHRDRAKVHLPPSEQALTSSPSLPSVARENLRREQSERRESFSPSFCNHQGSNPPLSCANGNFVAVSRERFASSEPEGIKSGSGAKRGGL